MSDGVNARPDSVLLPLSLRERGLRGEVFAAPHPNLETTGKRRMIRRVNGLVPNRRCTQPAGHRAYPSFVIPQPLTEGSGPSNFPP
jgi:hypothetical protein